MYAQRFFRSFSISKKVVEKFGLECISGEIAVLKQNQRIKQPSFQFVTEWKYNEAMKDTIPVGKEDIKQNGKELENIQQNGGIGYSWFLKSIYKLL